MSLEGGPEWSSIAVDDHWIRVFQAGPHQASEAVVFIHGNPGSAADFENLVNQVAPPRRAVAFDIPDFGQSIAAPGFKHTQDEYANFIGDALKALGIRRAHLVLHDLGGPIGLQWASTHTGQVASVTLINTGILAGYKWHRTARVWQTPVAGEILQAAAFRSMFRRVISNQEPKGLPRPFVDEMYDNYDRRTRRAVVVDEGWRTGSLSGEIAARVQEACFWHLDAPVARVDGGGSFMAWRISASVRIRSMRPWRSRRA